MNKIDFEFAQNIKEIFYRGNEDADVRPVYSDGEPAKSKFITQVLKTYDLSRGEFPITTLRPIPWRSGIKEILWIYQDQSNDLELLESKYGVTWWKPWDIGDGTIGERYGATIKRYDLMNSLLDGLIKDPYGRRHIIDMYQYESLTTTKGLHPCAFMTMWSVRNGYLDMTLVQRSSDMLVAMHINAIQYVALQMMVARHCGYKIGKFSHFIQNMHIYDRHFDQAAILMARQIRYGDNPTPRLILDPNKTDFYSFTEKDFTIEDYTPIKPQLKFELGV